MIELRETLVVSLPHDTARRDHIVRHFAELDLPAFRFIDAVGSKSRLVGDYYRDNKVAPFPPCFRCGQYECGCPNNILIPSQVANWLSFAKVWEICAQSPDSYFLICEDDVSFHQNADAILRHFCAVFEPQKTNVLVRLGASGQQPFQILDPASFHTTADVVMSNCAYVINGHMARYLLDHFNYIPTTSDVWVHDRIAAHHEVQAVTLSPLLATDLSYNKEHAKFLSRIHPKGIDANDAERQSRHVMRAASPHEYSQLLRSWRSPGPLKQWNYLASPPFQMRYMLAAGLLRKFENILEIGSYKTPLFQYLDDDAKRVISLDPMIFEDSKGPNQESRCLDYRAMELDPFKGAPFALVILGLDLTVSYKLKLFIKQAEVVVLEYPEDETWKRSRETFDALAQELGLNVLARVNMNLENNDFSAFLNENEWPPRTNRFIVFASAKYNNMAQIESKSPFKEPLGEIDTRESRLINTEFAGEMILSEAAFDFSHGAFAPANYLGGALLYYMIPYMLRAKSCVCLGSGGGLAPRLMRQAQRDIGLKNFGRTILIDGDMGEFGRPNWVEEDSALRQFYPDIEIRLEETGAASEKMRSEGIRIDYLHIDADHSHEGSLRDFDNYAPLVAPGGLITFHDTRPDAHPNTTCWKTVEDIRARGFEVLNLPDLASGVAIIKPKQA